ncbi:MAG: asparagine synthase (glutamine-hydrolyzing) [Nitrospirae bacterium]|nr:asparagine synthase (glutamine-hydrolyzing) [Nitrospirota bacterium]
MCGIAGVWNFNRTLPSTDVLRRMADSLRHRGPDAEGFHLDEHFGIGLAHRRLSIIDLSEQANQPMSDSFGEAWIVFNGEIYNYVELREELARGGEAFRTQSDTEVILGSYRRWGMDFLSKLRGMFALALFDARQGVLLLARDRAGKKPLYYSIKDGRLLFGSEPKAILASGHLTPEPDMQGLECYLTLGFVPPPKTGFKNVQKLPPGCVMTVRQNGSHSIETYWKPDFANKTNRSVQEWEEIVRDRLREAVRMRLRSDVPLGVFLSGGIDSSAVTAFAAEHVGRVKTYTIGFPQAQWDERKYARLVADRFSTEHHEFVVEPKPMEILPRVVKHYEDPIADASVIPTLYVSQTARQHVTVVLNGDGGDEVFAGYRGYQAYAAAKLLHAWPGSRSLGKLAAFIPDGGRGSAISRLKNLLALARDAHHYSLERYSMGLTQPEVMEPLFGRAWPRNGPLYSQEISQGAVDIARTLGGVDPVLYLNMVLGLPGGLLVKMDRASMAFSLEARSPFLDHLLVETMASVPPNLKLHGLTSKYLLKRALKNILPDEILHRSKMGFGVPLGEWFRNELRGFLEDTLGNGRLVSREWMAKDPVQRLIQEHVSRRKDHWPVLWTLLFLELWWREYLRD